ncbi:leucine-rich repeat and calponin homology domain-containing protein 4-like isoform X8 [Anneissia japonica]|uniref:leucine-rich repeat and calponin homology domain-containing protein 4-like isoform X8 n=1 Tax=Anneissia japonica TaxID=1529436 RepID=UPI001425A7E0|nr:leucine-rich repeat and calponin homology domain-containing protein 4-like isoform X8 [Anneissia japonica]
MAVQLSSPQSGAQLRSLEKVLDDAHRSGRLNLSSRKIRDFPKVADKYDLRDTVDVDLSKNRFIEFPEELCEFFSLENLNCYKNVLKSIPDKVNQLRSLRFLNLSRNQLTILPSGLCELFLEVLNVSNNKLVSLPEHIGQLSELSNLDASCNEISTLPSSIANLKSLRHLNVRHNRLVNLPEELSKLKLNVLDISCNKITHIPSCYRKIHTLEKLILDHNPLVSPSPQICMRGRIHIFKFLANEAHKEEGRKKAIEEDWQSRHQSTVDQFSYFNGKPGELRRAHGITDSGYVDGDKRWPSENQNDNYIIKRAENQRHRRGNLARPSAIVIPKDNGFIDSDEVDGSDGDITPTQIHPPDDVDFSMLLGGLDYEEDRPPDIERLKKEMLQAEQLSLKLKQVEQQRIQQEKEENNRLIEEQERREEQRRLEEKQMRFEEEQRRLQEEKRQLEEQQRRHELKRQEMEAEEEKRRLQKEKDEAEEQEKEERRKAAKKIQEEQQRIMQRQSSSERLKNTRTRRPTSLNTGNGSLVNGRTVPTKTTEEDRAKRRENIISKDRHEAQLARRRLEEAKAKTKQTQKSAVASYVKNRSPGSVDEKPKSKYNGSSSGSSSSSMNSTSKSYPSGTGLAALKPRSSLSSGKPSSMDSVNPRYTLKREAQKMQEEFAQLDMLRKPSTHRCNLNNSNNTRSKKPDRREVLRVNLEARLKHPLSDDLSAAIKDGYALCHLVNSVRTRAVPSIHVPPPSPSKLSMAKCRKNVENFIEACRRLGVTQDKLCSAADILEEKGILRVANTVQSLLMLYPGSNKAVSTV